MQCDTWELNVHGQMTVLDLGSRNWEAVINACFLKFSQLTLT
ncbi:Uncharacterised protein [Vibrio cholerae]|nr:Uncharacterised protein [Vibrio cholerae]